MPTSHQIDVAGAAPVGALLYRADSTRKLGATIVLGHGAGAGQRSNFMVAFATGLAARGVDAITFNFPYSEQRRRVPDRNSVLEATWRAAITFARQLPALENNRLFAGGKSMGGRIASQVAAAGDAAAQALAGLIFLGYPLHPPGKPHQLRSAHLPAIRCPMLFVQGTRDPFGAPAELQRVLQTPSAEVHIIANGDHSLVAPKGSPRTREEIYEEIQDRIVAWISNVQ